MDPEGLTGITMPVVVWLAIHVHFIVVPPPKPTYSIRASETSKVAPLDLDPGFSRGDYDGTSLLFVK